MQTKEYSVYNETRENFLSSRVTFIDTKSDPLRAVKVLIEGLAPNAETGLWLNPLKNIPTVPRLSSYDLVYLDKECRVLRGMALVADDDAPPFEGLATSALVLPIHSFSASHSHPGDKVILCAAEQLECPTSAPKQPAAPAPSPAAPLPQTAPPEPLLADPPSVLQPSVSTDTPPSRIPEKDWVRFRFLRSIVRLRVHISISVSPISGSGVTASPAAQGSSFPALHNHEVHASARARMRPIVLALTAHFAGTTRAVAQRYHACKRHYMRWADAFFFRPASNPSPLVQRWIPSLGKLFLSAIFPR